MEDNSKTSVTEAMLTLKKFSMTVIQYAKHSDQTIDELLAFYNSKKEGSEFIYVLSTILENKGEEGTQILTHKTFKDYQTFLFNSKINFQNDDYIKENIKGTNLENAGDKENLFIRVIKLKERLQKSVKLYSNQILEKINTTNDAQLENIIKDKC